MTDKEVQLFILRYLEAGNTEADEHILTDVPVELKRDRFIDALSAIENRGFLCPNYYSDDSPALKKSYVSDMGRAFIKRNSVIELAVTEQQEILAPLKQQFGRMENKQDKGQKDAKLGIRLAIWGIVVTIVSAAVFSDNFRSWILGWFH